MYRNEITKITVRNSNTFNIGLETLSKDKIQVLLHSEPIKGIQSCLVCCEFKKCCKKYKKGKRCKNCPKG